MVFSNRTSYNGRVTTENLQCMCVCVCVCVCAMLTWKVDSIRRTMDGCIQNTKTLLSMKVICCGELIKFLLLTHVQYVNRMKHVVNRMLNACVIQYMYTHVRTS